jgi:HSP20 family protein
LGDFVLCQKGGEYQITADVPGRQSEAVHVHSQGDKILIVVDPIRAPKPDETAAGEIVHLWERRCGKLTRDIRFPPRTIDMESISANCKDGLLTITVQKLIESAPSREIRVHRDERNLPAEPRI